MLFAKLDDSPMLRTQIQSLEESAEILRERCLKFHKGCRKYTEGLGEAYDGDIAFASSLETFGGGHNDPISVAFGGPVMTKFTIALRELGTYKEVLRSQVEHMLNDRLLNFVDIDLHDVKDARKRFDKASLLYDQVRDKYLSLKKGTRADITTAIEDELHNARSSFEQARFNLVTSISHIEAKKRFEFLEAGYDLLHQMEPYINQVLAYAQQSRERANKEQASLVERMHEYKKQIDREIRLSNGLTDAHNGDGIQTIARSSHKMIEAVMQSASKGKVQTIRQGYLSKRSSNLRADWKRRFFVLDSRGMLYYYRKQINRTPGGCSSHPRSIGNPTEHGSGLLSRLFSSHYHGIIHDEKSVARHTVNLLTSTIKVDAEQSDLRFCFRIISPTKVYTLQAESAIDQMDWIEKITGVIASLLSSQSPEQCFLLSPKSCGHDGSASESSSFTSQDLEPSIAHGLDTAWHFTVSKPKHSDPFSAKEKFIHAKYADKEFVRKYSMDEIQLAQQMWDNVTANDKRAVYSLIVQSRANVNLVYGEMSYSSRSTTGRSSQQEHSSSPSDGSPVFFDCHSHEKVSPREPLSPASTSSRVDDGDERCEGFSLLHLACHVADVGMVELLLQYGANVNAIDSRGRTPLHQCILKGRHIHAKLLLSRGANPQVADQDGRTALQCAIDGGTSDDEILVLLEDYTR
ncbi:hypothetical protein OsI_30058 [Oryza sativa Indica Group]|uniref:PH domain-containing protein n=1 Tax=Oryza sativa subsp. indica TaxID=39946 RepID=B8B950_ORYSI|nr:hypothetical protein OsI_30058 [Oryza sativa Indica Group]